MKLNDDAVLAAMQLRGGDAPMSVSDLLEGLPEELLTRATGDAAGHAAVQTVQESIDRLEAAGYVAAPAAGTRARRVTDAGRAHLVAIGVPPPP
jgi:hypothetical protein